MKIGILGAPGSGKTRFANELQQEFHDTIPIGEGGVTYVLDGYVGELRNNTGREYGEFGDFVDDLQVVFKRREWELTWRDARTITCGTVLDSVIHNFLRTEAPAKERYEVGLHLERLKSVAATFGLLYMDLWDYDYAFFLPTDDEYGRAMRSLIATYRAPVFTFNPEVPDDEKASTAIAAIRSLEEDQLPAPQERRVRSGSEDGGEDGDSPDSVPDVSEPGDSPDDA